MDIRQLKKKRKLLVKLCHNLRGPIPRTRRFHHVSSSGETKSHQQMRLDLHHGFEILEKHDARIVFLRLICIL